MLDFRPRRWLVHLALAFGAGIFLGFYVSAGPVWAAGAAVCLLWTGLLRWQKKSLYLPCMALMVLLGLLRCAAAAHPALPPEQTYDVTAQITGEAKIRESDGRVAVYLKNVRLTGTEGVYRAYWTYWPKEEGEPLPLDGQTVRFTGRVYHPSGQVNPHGFDFRLYLLQKGVTLGVSGGEDVELTPGDQQGPRSLLLRLRQSIGARLDALLGQDSALAHALLLNDKSDMPEDMAESFRLAGVAHVLAVSGLHVMILFGFLTLALRRLSPSPVAVAAVGGVLLAGYSLLVGAQAAVLRAGLLMLYIQAGRIARRRTDRLTGLAAAFGLILLLRPLELFSAGFQMSFSAVLGIVLLGDRMEQLLRRVKRARLRRVLNAYGITLCATLGAALPVSWYYHRLSLAGFLINPLICAAVTALMPMLLVLLAISAASLPAAALLGKAVALLCHLLTEAVRLTAQLPFASLRAPRLPYYMMAALAAALVLCTRYVLLRRRSRALLAAALLAGAGLTMGLTRNRDARYIQLSMGSADAAVIEDGNATVVIDTGESGGDLAGYLLSEGRRADTVILSHLHIDHALGLSELLRQGVPMGKICLSTEAEVTPVAESVATVLEQARAAGIPIEYLRAGDSLRLERTEIRVLWPQEGGANPGADANDFALALRVDLDGVVLLHMSDVSGTYEMYAAAPADVLRVAHHGSASSTGERFLQAVSPAAALISTRRASDKTLERLAEAGVLVYDTNAWGALTLTVRGGGARIRGFIQ